MVYITGDIHGDLSRFNDKRLNKLKKNDFLIVCGDFGFIWDGSKKEKRILKKLGNKKYYILFVEGCHENYDILENYPTEQWHGGTIRPISGTLINLCRGNIYEIDGKKFFTFGGGQSIDKDLRKETKTYFKRELPSDEELEFGISNLNKNNNKVDYIITHEPPSVLIDFLDKCLMEVEANEMNTTFTKISETCKYKKWFFGKCHKNKIIPPRYHCVFNDIIPIE